MHTITVTRGTPTTRLAEAAAVLVLPAALLTAAFYNGPGRDLTWLALTVGLLALWISVSLSRMEFARPILFACGWLPAFAVAYLAWLLLNSYFSTFPYASRLHGLALAVLPLAFLGWLVQPRRDRQATWDKTWKLLVVCGSPLAIWGIADFALSQQRAHGPLIDANAFGALMNMLILPLAFGYLKGHQPAPKLLGRSTILLSAALFSLAQFMTLSRGAFLALAVTLPVAIWLSRATPGFRPRLVRLLLVLIACYSVVKVAPIEEHPRLELLLAAPLEQIDTDASIKARLLLWKSTWQMYRDANPLVGTGLGTFKIHYPAYRAGAETESGGNYAHNDYLQALQEGGAVQFLFLVILTLIAPVWLFSKSQRTTLAPGKESEGEQDVAGLMLGIVAISLHATVNFIHEILPLTLLTGLYLARAWEMQRPLQEFRALSSVTTHIRPGLVKSVLYLFLAIPTAGLAMDAIVFRTLVGKHPLIKSIRTEDRVSLVSALIVLRSGNPIPREALIRSLISEAEKSEPETRAALLGRASEETKSLARQVPGYPPWLFFMGKIDAVRGQWSSAREFFERGIQRAPQSTEMRLALIEACLQQGEEEAAYQQVEAAKQWIWLESDRSRLAMFVEQAHALTLKQGEPGDADFWLTIRSKLQRPLPAV